MCGTGSYFYGQGKVTGTKRNLSEDALMALIKNDQKAFEKFLAAGGDIHSNLPVIEGMTFTVAEGMAVYERQSFMKLLSLRKIKYVTQAPGKDYDILSIATTKNNPALLNQLMEEKPTLDLTYGPDKWTLMHLASSSCAHKVTPILHEKGLGWNTKDKNGTTPLTLAAQNDCLPVLGYWKEQRADFRSKDGNGRSALSILGGKKSAASKAFAQSLEPKSGVTAVGNGTTVAQEDSGKERFNFYKIRKNPKDQVVDHNTEYEPGDRPFDVDTSDLTEFQD